MSSDIHALSGAYAIDALDDLERAQFERHLAECSECRAEVDSLREAAGLLPETSAAEPPTALRERILAEAATVRPLPPVTPPVTPRATRHRRLRLAPLVAAAAVVAALGAGAVVWHPWSDETPAAQQLSPADRVRNAPDAVTVTRRIDGGEATIIASRSLNKFVVTTRDLPPLQKGKVYEMWLNDPRHGMVPVSGGLMTAADSTVVLSGDVSHALGAGITIEPATGSKAPTSEPVAVFEFETA